MRPEICRNCGSNEFVERETYYECPYCDTQYQKQPTAVIKEVHYVPAYGQPASRPTKPYDVTGGRKRVNKWVALLICYFFGLFGGHKFYEGKTGAGILYLCTVGLFGIGWIVDLIAILFKPNPYYV